MRCSQRIGYLLLDVEFIVPLADGGAIEGVGLQNVGTSLQEGRVDFLYHLCPHGQHNLCDWHLSMDARLLSPIRTKEHCA
jgi:hypothetical protein